MNSVIVRPVYSCRRRSRRQLWGVQVDGYLMLICTRYPSWISKVDLKQ